MKNYTAKIHNADLNVGHVVNLAVIERVFDREKKPLGDSLIGAVDCRIVSVGAHWSNQPRGEAGRWYDVEPLKALPKAAQGKEILIGIL